MNKELKNEVQKEVTKYFRRIASEGGKARARKHSKAQLRKWAKLGGRPPKKRSGR